MPARRRKFVICALGGSVNPYELPAARLDPGRSISGGERSLYELAHALTRLGHDVELRGEIAPLLLRQIGDATEVSVAARDLPPRRPAPDETVVVAEGLQSPLDYAASLTSPGPRVMMVLAPPGLFGWPFVDGWTLPDPLTVDPSTVSTPKQLHEIHRSGYHLWTHSRGLARSMEAASVPHDWIGCGQPVAPPPAPNPAARSIDVVYVADNRWASLARRAATGIDGTVRELGRSTRDELLDALADARIVLLPARVEGTARIQIEARSVGTVPICLPNPYGEGLTEDEGTVVVEDVDAMAAAANRLLADTERLDCMSDRARRASATLTDWERYVERVAMAVARIDSESDPRSLAFAGLGDATAPWLGDLQVRLAGAEESAEIKHRQVVELATRVDELTADLLRLGDRHAREGDAWGKERSELLAACEETRLMLDAVRVERDRGAEELADTRRQLHTLLNTKAVRALKALKHAVGRERP